MAEFIDVGGVELEVNEKTSELFNFINETQMMIERMGIHRSIIIEAKIDKFAVTMRTETEGYTNAAAGGICVRKGVITTINKLA